jgi:hypothetical protein
VRVIKAENARAASMPAPARFSNLQCPPFAPESEHPAYAPQSRKLNFKNGTQFARAITDFWTSVHAPIVSRVSGGLLDRWIDDFKCVTLQSLQFRIFIKANMPQRVTRVPEVYEHEAAFCHASPTRSSLSLEAAGSGEPSLLHTGLFVDRRTRDRAVRTAHTTIAGFCL